MSFFDLFRWCGFAPNPKPAPTVAPGPYINTTRVPLDPRSMPSIYLNPDGSPRDDYEGLAMAEQRNVYGTEEWMRTLGRGLAAAVPPVPPSPPNPANEDDWNFEEPPYLEFDADLAEDYDHEWNNK